MRKLLIILAAFAVSFPSFAADNTVILTPGSGITMKSKDVGSGVQAMQPIISDATGTALGTTTNTLQAGSPASAFVDGWSITHGAKADAACSTDNGTCSLVALQKRTNQNLSSGTIATGTAGSPASAVLTVQGIASATPVIISEVPVTTGGLSVYFVQPAASDNHVVIKAGAGQVYKLMVTNNSATVNYLRLYNATTGFNGCNSATNLVYQAAIPASTSVGGLSDSWSQGMVFATGISICITSGYATTDTTNATASAMSVNIGYK